MTRVVVVVLVGVGGLCLLVVVDGRMAVVCLLACHHVHVLMLLTRGVSLRVVVVLWFHNGWCVLRYGLRVLRDDGHARHDHVRHGGRGGCVMWRR